MKVDEIVEYLLSAEQDAHEIDKVTNEYPSMSVEEAYYVQSKLLEKREETQETKHVGVKLGLTSKAKQQMMGVDEAIYGYLQADMLAKEWEPISFEKLIHPKAEPEIAFFLKEDLSGDVTEEDVIRATAYVAPALEIIDSRYRDFKFTLVDVIADNCSSKLFVVGSQMTRPNMEQLQNMGMSLTKNGEVVQTGTSAAVLGHPATAIAWAVKQMARRGEKLKAGDVVLSGAVSEAVAFHSGDTIVATFNGLGSVEMTCK